MQQAIKQCKCQEYSTITMKTVLTVQGGRCNGQIDNVRCKKTVQQQLGRQKKLNQLENAMDRQTILQTNARCKYQENSTPIKWIVQLLKGQYTNEADYASAKRTVQY